MQVCPACKRVTCTGCEDKDARPTTHIRISRKQIERRKIEQYKQQIREILSREGGR